MGDTLLVDFGDAGHALLSWQVPAVDASHDAATLYRIDPAAGTPTALCDTGLGSATFSHTALAWDPGAQELLIDLIAGQDMSYIQSVHDKNII